ncbi:MAG: MinD/ParA family protein [Armatimonadetes bacterium]|nr:MinD/ParA family protein [Armatimonadota bacterium]
MKTIAITSGKGGVGKTCLSTNLSIALSHFGQNVVLFDADLQLANVDVALGIRAEKTLRDVVSGEVSLKDALTPGPGGIRVAVGGSAIGTLMTAGPKRLGQFFDQIASLQDSTDFLIYDTAAGLENRVTTFLKNSEETILVTTPDPTAITDAYATAKVLFKKNPEATIRVVVNMVACAEEGYALFGHLNSVCKRFLDRELEYLGHVRQDPKAAQATRARKPVVLLSPDSAAAEDYVHIARAVWDLSRNVRGRQLSAA